MRNSSKYVEASASWKCVKMRTRSKCVPSKSVIHRPQETIQFPQSVIPSEARDPLLGSQRGEALQCLHLGQQVQNSIHRSHQQSGQQNLPAREGLVPGFTSRYRIHRLVYFETVRDVRAAIAGEKHIKGWTRAKRVALIEARNSTWEDLSAEMFPPFPRKADPSLRSG